MKIAVEDQSCEAEHGLRPAGPTPTWKKWADVLPFKALLFEVFVVIF